MSEPVIFTIGGGKGGIGKTFISANLGAMASRTGLRVGFIDADLGGANLHLLLGVRRPRIGLADFMAGSVQRLAEATVETIVPNSWLVSGVGEGVRLANPTFLQKKKLINQIRSMEADYIIVDLGAGADFDNSDFFAAFPFSIVVTDSLPTSVENAYAYLKNGIVRGLCHLFSGNRHLQDLIRDRSGASSTGGSGTVDDLLHRMSGDFPAETRTMKEWLRSRKVFLVINMVKDEEEIVIGRRFVEMVRRYLSIEMLYIGYVVYTQEVRSSIKNMKPAVMTIGPSPLYHCFESLLHNVTTLTRGT